MQLTLLNDSGKFDGLDDTIRHVFAETAHKLNALFDLSQLDVTFSPFAEGDAPDSGIGGWAINMYRIELQLDLERPDIKEVIITELPAVLAHEVHHIVQKKNKVEAETLAENLILKGWPATLSRGSMVAHSPRCSRSLITMTGNRSWQR